MATISCITCGIIIGLVLVSTVAFGISDTLQSDARRTYLQQLLNTIGNGSSISQANITTFLDRRNTVWPSSDQFSDCLINTTGTLQIEEHCLHKLCLSPEEVYTISGLDHDVSEERLSTLSTILLLLSENEACQGAPREHADDFHHHGNFTHVPPSMASVWGFGILCTTLINLCSLTGVVVLPFIHGNKYKGMLIYMVALAVGTLAGSSILFLIPEALELTGQNLDMNSYVWKASTVIIGIYVFFLIERIMKTITLRQEKRQLNKLKARQRIHRDSAMSFASFHKGKEIPEYRKTDELSVSLPCCNPESNSNNSEDGSLSDTDMSRKESAVTLDKVSTTTKKPLIKHHHHTKVAPVAYMIIFGDGLHNFIDGISIGAAFTESILAGVSVSIAILCEEFPHELGDFAVLLNAGMKVKKAILYNFLSSTMCYLGLVVGIFLGENTASHTWVFAFAGGMFLYISLVDMMPEMNGAAEDEENKAAFGSLCIFLLQNLGLITGFVIMLMLAMYGGHLEEAIRGR